MSDFSRRKFLKTGAAALAGITIAPSSILGMSHGHVSPTDKLNLAAVGIGGVAYCTRNFEVEDLEIITMYAYEGYDITEISKVYGVSSHY